MKPYLFDRPVSFRVSKEDFQLVADVAKGAGKSVSAFGRAAVLQHVKLEVKKVRVRRRGPSDEALRLLIAELGRHGSLMNQIARHLNSGGPVGDIAAAHDQLYKAYEATMVAVIELTKLRKPLSSTTERETSE
jgi:hypothetical protein